MKKGKIFIISGPSGSGKTTLHKKLLQSKRFKRKLTKTISVTTRSRRPNEREGRDYLFVSRKKFLYMRRTNHFLESKKVFDHYYGTPRKQVRDILSTGKSAVLCIDVKGAKVVFRKNSRQSIGIFVKTTSLRVLKKRLMGRASEGREEAKLRLKVASKELREAKHYKYVLINDNLLRSYMRLEGIIDKELS